MLQYVVSMRKRNAGGRLHLGTIIRNIREQIPGKLHGSVAAVDAGSGAELLVEVGRVVSVVVASSLWSRRCCRGLAEVVSFLSVAASFFLACIICSSAVSGLAELSRGKVCACSCRCFA